MIKTVLLLLIVISGNVMAADVNELIKAGITFHDQGDYKTAIEKYNQALEIEPNNPLALYELTFSYMLSHNNEECIKTAQKGLKIKSDLQKKFSLSMSNCYSQQGDFQKAIDLFKKELESNPADAELHLNIAVTLTKTQQYKEAISHLKEAIKNANGYATPYYYLAELYSYSDYQIPAIYLYMEFIKLEPNSRRTEDAAQKLVSLFYQSIKQQENGDISVSVNPDSPKDEGDFTSIELALALSAAQSRENKALKTRLDRFTYALTNFVTICSEQNDKNLSSTFTWKYAAKNMIYLQNKEVFNTYAHFLAARAGIENANDWLNANTEKLEKLSRIIQSR